MAVTSLCWHKHPFQSGGYAEPGFHQRSETTVAHIPQLTQVHSPGKTLFITLVLSRGTDPATNSVAMGTPSPQAAVLQLRHLLILKVSLKKITPMVRPRRSST